MATNITAQLTRIAHANGKPPGHVDYMNKRDMAAAAQSLLDEYGDALHSVFECRLQQERSRTVVPVRPMTGDVIRGAYRYEDSK